MPAHFHVVAYPVVPLEPPSLESLVVMPGPSRQQDRSRRSSGMHRARRVLEFKDGALHTTRSPWDRVGKPGSP